MVKIYILWIKTIYIYTIYQLPNVVSSYLHLTPNARPLMGNVVLQCCTEGCFSPASANAPVVHQEKNLTVVVQAAGVTGRVLDVVSSRKTAL